MKGKLYLIPNTLGSNTAHVIPSEVALKAISLRHFIVEDIRTARRYLKLLNAEMDIDSSQFYVLNKHTSPRELSDFLTPLKNGNDMGIISEAGCPGVADPGAEIVQLAHKEGIKVIPMTGPSSILLALMASGMNGQSFAFNGYLPIKRDERIKAIKHFENRSRIENQSQIFIEAPYRNMALAEDILNCTHPNTQLCIACNITLPDEYIVTNSVCAWKGKLPDLHKKPSIFIILAE
ncbi:MAG: SAM-dependent methyltransferase [Cytophagaceae bacterium]|jgi:16S rRNA (cytidine1402-2'-O)-methyltransferase|nr:SAM-dependent methyltransferase [Cytophagaceae bacterium]